MEVHTTTDEKGDVIEPCDPHIKVKDEISSESSIQQNASHIKFKIGSDHFNSVNNSNYNTSGDSTPISCPIYENTEQNIAEQEKLRKQLSDHHQNNPDVYSDKADEKNSRESVDYKDVHFGIFSMLSFLKTEITRTYKVDKDDKIMNEKRHKVYTFALIPFELEKFMFFGVYQCADAFLYIFTILPLRFFLSIYKFIRYQDMLPVHVCDILKVSILAINYLCIQHIDVSMMYHLIKGQAIIKLYIFFSMLEVADRLFSSFGQDILDTVFYTVSNGKMNRKRDFAILLLHFCVAILYVFLHTVLIMFQTTTLSVAFNSHNKALLTIMMSNNFVELKGSVFKKFEKNNLFQMSCSDIRERFHFIILLSLVCLRNLPEFSWDANTHLYDHLIILMPDVLMVMIFEIMVDWVKHAFITKFNTIEYTVYQEYTTSICYDMAASKEKNTSSDYMDIVSRRMVNNKLGFVPIPLAVLVFRVSMNCIWKLKVDILYVILFFPCLLVLKCFFSAILLKLAINRIRNEQNVKKSKMEQDERIMTQGKIIERSLSLAMGLNPDIKVMDHCVPFTYKGQLLTSNSTVSIQSMGFNENYINEINKSNDGLRHRKLAKTTPKPLSEVDRYTMCSNRII